MFMYKAFKICHYFSYESSTNIRLVCGGGGSDISKNESITFSYCIVINLLVVNIPGSDIESPHLK